MKKLIVIIICILAMASMAWADSNVTLQWTANTENDLAGYRIYRGAQAGGPYTQVGNDIACGPNDATCCEFIDMNIPDGTYCWVATAFDTSGNESEYSNEVIDTLDSVAPAPPQEMNVFKKIIAYIERHYMGYTVSITKIEPAG